MVDIWYIDGKYIESSRKIIFGVCCGMLKRFDGHILETLRPPTPLLSE